MIEQQFLSDKIVQAGFKLPESYKRVFELGLTTIPPWYFLENGDFQPLYEGLQSRYQEHFLLPFARRQYNDDVACFVIISPRFPKSEVLVIHDFASPGYEVDENFQSFWDWFRRAIDDVIEWSEV